MCSEVFILDEYEKRILKFLALHGPLNLNQLSKFTAKFVDSLERWGVKKRLYGSSRFMGLIPFEYVEERDMNKHRFGKDEKKFYLTVKGIIAISSIVHLQKNFFFKKYSEFYSNVINIPNTKSFFETFVEQNIKLMIAWHFLNGIQLTKQQSSSFYYSGFFSHLKSSGLIDITINDEEIKKEFKELFQNCVSDYTILDIVTHGKLFFYRTPLSLVDWKKTIRVKDSRHKFLGRVWEWPTDLDDIRFFEESNTSKKTTSLKMPVISSDEYYNNETKNKVDKKLEKMNYKTNWKRKPIEYYAN